jgi:hypothetical protein
MPTYYRAIQEICPKCGTLHYMKLHLQDKRFEGYHARTCTSCSERFVTHYVNQEGDLTLHSVIAVTQSIPAQADV